MPNGVTATTTAAAPACAAMASRVQPSVRSVMTRSAPASSAAVCESSVTDFLPAAR